MGTKGSSKGKFLAQDGPKVLQPEESLWFCIWHIYAPFPLGTSLSPSEWRSIFKTQCQKYAPLRGWGELRGKRKARSLRYTAQDRKQA